MSIFNCNFCGASLDTESDKPYDCCDPYTMVSPAEQGAGEKGFEGEEVKLSDYEKGPVALRDRIVINLIAERDDLKAQLAKAYGQDYYEANKRLAESNRDLTQKLAAMEKELIESKHWHNEARSWNKPLSDQVMKLQAANAKLVSALEKCCEHEPDGFGSFVADEFTEPCVLDGRKLLAEIEAKREADMTGQWLVKRTFDGLLLWVHEKELIPLTARATIFPTSGAAPIKTRPTILTVNDFRVGMRVRGRATGDEYDVLAVDRLGDMIKVTPAGSGSGAAVNLPASLFIPVP